MSPEAIARRLDIVEAMNRACDGRTGKSEDCRSRRRPEKGRGRCQVVDISSPDSPPPSAQGQAVDSVVHGVPRLPSRSMFGVRVAAETAHPVVHIVNRDEKEVGSRGFSCETLPWRSSTGTGERDQPFHLFPFGLAICTLVFCPANLIRSGQEATRERFR